MAALDATAVNVALPSIGAEFDVPVRSLQWVLTGYLLALASIILLGGALGDRFGRRRIFLLGTVWFAVASVACAAAPSVELLVAARIVQGAGAALLTPGSLAILQASFRENDRARAVGAWSGLGGVAGAVGPFVGGWLVDGPGWRWAFLINVPVAVVVLVCSLGAVPESRDPHAPRHLDLVGAGLAVVGLGAATWALTEGGSRGWTDPSVATVCVIAATASVAFVRRMTHTAHPLVPPALFDSRDFTVTNLATTSMYAAIGVAFFLVAYELQVGVGWSALASGTALLPATALMLIGSSRSAALAAKFGSRPQLAIGPVLVAVGLTMLSRVGPGATWSTDVLPGTLVFGVGLVTFVAPLTATVMSSVSVDHVSTASGVNNAVARTSGLVALAVIPAVSGLATASGAAAVTESFGLAMRIAALVAVLAAPVALIGLRPGGGTAVSPRRIYCPVDGPPIQPDPSRCRTVATAPRRIRIPRSAS